jgi:nucleotide-binding universal stress UspA family protein
VAARETEGLPLLKSAESVQILEVNQSQDERAPSDLGLAATLARHGIKTTWRRMVAPDISVGDEILSRLADQGADLLVMGAYGHSRMRELIFGGVTHHIARHMTAPTVWSH